MQNTDIYIEYEILEAKSFAEKERTSIQAKKFIASRWGVDNILCRLMLSSSRKNLNKALRIKETLTENLYHYRLEHMKTLIFNKY